MSRVLTRWNQLVREKETLRSKSGVAARNVLNPAQGELELDAL